MDRVLRTDATPCDTNMLSARRAVGKAYILPPEKDAGTAVYCIVYLPLHGLWFVTYSIPFPPALLKVDIVRKTAMLCLALFKLRNVV